MKTKTETRGRPQKTDATDDHYSEALFTKITPATDKTFSAMCERYGMSKADVLRRILDDALSSGWTPIKSMERRAAE